MEKILITGGAGYIGSILATHLINKGYEITIFDNFLYNQSSLLDICHKNNLHIVNGDVRDNHKINPEIKKSDIIIPLAALVGAPICKKDPKGSEDINKNSIFNLLENISKNQIIIMPTTNSAYGGGQGGVECDENSPLNPISKYALDKVEIEKKIMDRENTISLRLATVFGMSPRMRFDLLVNDFVRRAYLDRFIVLFESHFKRNYIHVKDVANCFEHCLENFSQMKTNIYNVGLSDANLSKKELCERIKKYKPDFVVLESEIEKDIDQRNYIVSNSKIESSGFKPMYNIDFGIKEILKGCEILSKKQYSNI